MLTLRNLAFSRFWYAVAFIMGAPYRTAHDPATLDEYIVSRTSRDEFCWNCRTPVPAADYNEHVRTVQCLYSSSLVCRECDKTLDFVMIS